MFNVFSIVVPFKIGGFFLEKQDRFIKKENSGFVSVLF
jgi:hypothetical protein